MTGTAVREIRRLSRGYAARQGVRVARRVALAYLATLALAALVHRLLVPVPGLAAIDGEILATVLLVVLACAAAALTGWAYAAATRPRGRTLARALDDRLGLFDAFDTALSVEARGAAGAMESLALSRGVARLSGLDPAALWGAPGKRGWAPIALAVLALFLLLAPGASGLWKGRGAGAGTDPGIGRHPAAQPGKAPEPPAPMDADRWMREHGTLRLEIPDPARDPLGWVARFATDRPLPAPYRARLSLVVDGKPPLSTGLLARGEEGKVGDDALPFRADDVEGVRPLLTPGKHTAFVRLSPVVSPWKAPLDSEPIEFEIRPPGAKPPSSGEPPPPPPPTPPPPPPPPPPPNRGDQGGEKPPPEVSLKEEVVNPLTREGLEVEKDKAVVAVRDPNAGTAPPKVVPLSEALREFEKVVERALSPERVRPADREFVRKYLEALKALAGGK